mgnify:CR=1 FL=1
MILRDARKNSQGTRQHIQCQLENTIVEQAL